MSPATERTILGPARKNKESSVINHSVFPGIWHRGALHEVAEEVGFWISFEGTVNTIS